MAPKYGIPFAVTILLAVGLACTLLPQPTPEVDVVATSVAATLAAADGAAPADDTPAPITETPAHQEEPAVILLRIAYVKNGQVWYWEEGGAARSLTSLGGVVDVILSPDGETAAFTRQLEDGQVELMAVDIDGTNQRTLVSPDQLAAMSTHEQALTAVPYQLDWVPGSRTVIYSTRLIFEGPGLIPQNDLRLVDADSGDQSELLAPGQGGAFHFSPDGNQIALVRPDQISVVNADGGGRRELLNFENVLTYSEYQYYPTPVWSADSSQLWVVIPPSDPLGEPTAPSKVWELAVDGSGAVERLSMVTIPFFVSEARLSPDLARVAYQSPLDPETPNLSALRIALLDGSGESVYERGNLTFYRWAHTGERFVFTVEDSIRIGEPGSPALVIGAAPIREVTWVDADSFLYLKRSGDTWELRWREVGTPGMLIDSAPDLSYDFIR